HARADHDVADEVERIGAADRDQRAVVRFLPDAAQQADRFGQRELLAAQAGDETAAADLAARFQAMAHAQQLAPRRQPLRLAREQAPADDAVALEQRAHDELDELGIVAAQLALVADARAAPQERPATRVGDAEQRRAPAAPARRRRAP